jgi:hypothetical protein
LYELIFHLSVEPEEGEKIKELLENFEVKSR